MKLLKGLFFTALALVTALLVIGLFLPRSAHIERSIAIGASPGTVYGLVDGFERFNEWSPWASLDPATQYTFSGPARGVGARMEWRSNNPDVGQGSQEILAVEPDRSVKSALDFGMDNPTTSTLTLVPEGSGTRATWTLDTDFAGSLLGRYFGLALDRMVGPDYEKGLAQLKTLAEAAQAAGTSTPIGQATPVPPIPQ